MPLKKTSIVHPGSRTDIFYLVCHFLITVNAFYLLALLIAPHLPKFGFYSSFLYQQPLFVQALSAVIIADFFWYWLHRLYHKALWRIHAIHHTVEHMDWLSNIRMHPLDPLLKKIVQAIPVSMLGFPPNVFLVYLPVLAFFATLAHANLAWTFGPFRYVLASPVFHHWHHDRKAQFDAKNFSGIFPIWDILFGTFYMPKKLAIPEYGIEDSISENVLNQLIYPFQSPVANKRADALRR
jgi:sterol desaturase/sphingolipid hydroxylase (fatty acid hydroxylase superfamily)